MLNLMKIRTCASINFLYTVFKATIYIESNN